MNNVIGTIFSLSIFFLAANIAVAEVKVRGYTRSDGTYVAPHVRSSPDSSKWNNYGPSKGLSDQANPRTRDNDHDGVINKYDRDDDNDGVSDNYDRNQYNARSGDYGTRSNGR